MKYNNYFFVVDVETGGLPSKLKLKAVHEVAITELALVVIENETLKIVEKRNWIFKPYKEGLVYEPEAAQVSGIDRDFCVANGLDMSKIMIELLSVIGKYAIKGRKHYLVGHGILKFDLDFMINLFALNGLNASKYFDDTVFDTLIFTRLKFIESHSFNLASSCDLANVSLLDAHRASADTLSTAELWIHHLKSLRSLQQDKEEGTARNRNNFQI